MSWKTNFIFGLAEVFPGVKSRGLELSLGDGINYAPSFAEDLAWTSDCAGCAGCAVLCVDSRGDLV